MAKKKEGWQIGQGKSCQDVEINHAPGDGNGGNYGRGNRDMSKLVYDDSNPDVAQRG